MYSNHIPQVRAEQALQHASFDDCPQPILICLLGSFRLIRGCSSAALSLAPKAETLFSHLALHHDNPVPREELIELLWPDTDSTLAAQSLHTLVYTLRKLFKDDLEGDPIVHNNGYYSLNKEAGIEVDIAQFEQLVDDGDRQMRMGRTTEAMTLYHRAIDLYHGDLCVISDPSAVIKREYLRARFLAALARLAEYYYSKQDYAECLTYTSRLLIEDPCREDAHRLLMHCYVETGQRAQALRQYQLCEQLLRDEFDAVPEQTTTALFDQIRRTPERAST